MARPSKPLLWVAAAAVALLAVWAWQHFGLGALLTLDNLKASRDALQAQVQAQPLATATVFFAVYVAAAALSIPGALILTLAAGAMFGLTGCGGSSRRSGSRWSWPCVAPTGAASSPRSSRRCPTTWTWTATARSRACWATSTPNGSTGWGWSAPS